MTTQKTLVNPAFVNAVCQEAALNLSTRMHVDVTPDMDEKIVAMIETRKRILNVTR